MSFLNSSKKYLQIKPGDLVLEVGSGDAPHPRADILCDRYLTSNMQRAGEFPIVVDRPLVVADAHHLPFKNKAFDYIICAHLLEHLESPERFLKELMRVGKAGYIETPSISAERLFGWDFHRWFVLVENKCLRIIKKEEGERFGGFYHRLIAQNIWFRRFFEENSARFNTYFEWEDQINYKVDKEEPAADFIKRTDGKLWPLMQKAYPKPREDLNFYFSWMKRRLIRKVRKELRKTLWSFKVKFQRKQIVNNILPILICPNCNSSELEYFRSYINCHRCKEKFPLIRSIPLMLKKTKERKFDRM